MPSWKKQMFAFIRFFILVSLLSFSMITSAKHVVTFDDMDGVRSDGNAGPVTSALSVDGKYLAISRGTILQIIDTATGRVLTVLGEGQLPHWSPNGTQLAYYSVRSGTMQLWLWNAHDGQVKQLTEFKDGVDPDPTTRVAGNAIDSFDYSWSPDSAQLVFVSRVAFSIPGWKSNGPLILDQTTPPERTLSGVFSHPSGATGGIAVAPDGRQYQYRAQIPGQVLQSRLFVANVKTHKVMMLDNQEANAFDPQWSPDGRWIAFATINSSATDIFSASSSEIRIRDVVKGGEKVVSSGKNIHYRPRWSLDSKSIAYLVGDPKLDIEMVTLDRSVHVTYAFEKRLLAYAWSHDNDSLLLSYSEPGRGGQLARFSFKEKTLQPIASGVERSWAQANDGALVWIEGATGPDIWKLSPLARLPTKVTRLTNDEHRTELHLGQVKKIRYRTAHGLELEGSVLYPPNYQPGKIYPLIVDGYPFLRGKYWMNPMLGNQAWAALGYVVFRPYIRAPHAWANCSGDAEYCALSRGPQGWDMMVDDVMSGVDELIRLKIADPARMCAYGFSNGGGVVSYLITRTDRFQCAVIVAPVWPNWVGAPLLSLQSWQLMKDWVGVDVLTDPEAYMKMSSVFRAKQVKTPVLLAAGDEDGMFLLGAIEMYNALRFAGVDVTLLRYPDQAHVLKGEGLRDLWTRELNFFNQYLRPEQK